VPEHGGGELVASYLLFAAVGWWVSDLAPALFVHLGIAAGTDHSISPPTGAYGE
jgi:hypothetical protein